MFCITNIIRTFATVILKYITLKEKDFEIMAPVGSYESLMAAIQGGADSIYFGIEGLNMRSRSSNNFTTDDLRKIVKRRTCSPRRYKLLQPFKGSF